MLELIWCLEDNIKGILWYWKQNKSDLERSLTIWMRIWSQHNYAISTKPLFVVMDGLIKAPENIYLESFFTDLRTLSSSETLH